MKINTALILCAGFGKRLNPLTLEKPKPLLKINNITLLEECIKLVEALGIKKIIINTFYLKEKIEKFLKKKNYNLDIKIINDGEIILNTGGGILKMIKTSTNSDFLIFNPDTLWNLNYIDDIQEMEKIYFNKKIQNILMVVNKKKSFDKSLKGDFNLEKNLINRKKNDLKYIYTGLQIIRPEVFLNSEKKIFSINKIWNMLIENNKLCGIKSNINFLHVNNISVYKDLIDKDFKH